jgi:hypothetical protein
VATDRDAEPYLVGVREGREVRPGRYGLWILVGLPHAHHNQCTNQRIGDRVDRRIDAHLAGTQFRQIMDMAVRNNDRFVVDRHGEPAVVILSVQDFVRSVAPPPDWLQKVWAGAKRRGLEALTLDDMDAEIATHRPSQKASAGNNA